jgi:hypothetical protein
VRENIQKGVILGCGNRSNAGMDTVTLMKNSMSMGGIVPEVSWVSSHRLRQTSESEFLPKGGYTESSKEGPSMGSTWEQGCDCEPGGDSCNYEAEPVGLPASLPGVKGPRLEHCKEEPSSVHKIWA